VRKLAGVVFVASLLAAPSAANAQRRPEDAQAQERARDARRGRSAADVRALELFEQSARAYREGRFQDAVDGLLEARRVKPEPVLLYNLGRAYEALGRTIDAADAYDAYLREEANAPDRRAIEGRIATLRAQAAELEKARAAPAAATSPERAPEAPPPREPSPTIVPWVVAGAGLAGVATGVVLGAFANGRHDDAVAERSQARAAEKQDAAESLASAATVTLIAGGIVAAVGLAWLGLDALARPRSSSLARGGGTSFALPLTLGGTF